MFARTIRTLRVAAVPRPALATRFNVPISIRTLATESTSATTETPALAAQLGATQSTTSSAQATTQAQIPKPPQHLPYYVGRNRMNNIAVYERRDRGGNLKKTLLKKGEGNLQALRFDVAEALGLSEKDVKVNSITNHVEIKVGAKDMVKVGGFQGSWGSTRPGLLSFQLFPFSSKSIPHDADQYTGPPERRCSRVSEEHGILSKTLSRRSRRTN